VPFDRRSAQALVSNVTQPEYGRSAFGIGYNRLIGAWIRAHYVLAGTIAQGAFRLSIFRPATAGPS
jgi:hypothetical protein